MMLWQIGCCIEGWNRVQGAEEKPEPMSDLEFDEAKRKAGFG